MEDLFLLFPDEQTASEVLVDYEGSVDVIGTIEGIDGWHVNTRGTATEKLLPYSIVVETPFRVWA